MLALFQAETTPLSIGPPDARHNLSMGHRLRNIVSRAAALSPLSMGLAIFTVAFLMRLVLAHKLGLYGQTVHFGELELIGKSIAETGVFGNPYKIPTGPTSHGAPFYPYLLSAIYRLFGYGTEARTVVLMGAISLAALALALLPMLAVRVGLPVWVGGGAGMLGGLLPFRVINELAWEVPYAVVGWIGAVVVTIGWLRNPSHARSVGCGAVWGALFWIAPQLAPPLALILLTSIRTLGWRTAWKAIPLVVVAAALTIFPWIWRNYRVLGAWSFVRGNLGIELAAAHYPGAEPDYNANCWPPDPKNYCTTRHPFTSASEAAVVKQMGEAAYNRWRMREAMGYIAADPAAFFGRTLKRTFMFWFIPSGGLPAKDLVLYPLALLSFLGAWRLVRQIPDAGGVLASCLLGYPLPYYFLSLMTRYIVPLFWLVLFLAAYALATLVPASGVGRGSPAGTTAGNSPAMEPIS
jgi:hypothetical protein